MAGEFPRTRAWEERNMAVVVGRFEMPKRLTKEEENKEKTYAKFVAEPFEQGYGYTIGNSLRRVLLSSLEGAAVTTLKIEGVHHEFTSIPGVVEDVTEVVLNIKKLLLLSHTRNPKKIELKVKKKGVVTAGDITADNTIEILNPDLKICTLDKETKLEIEMEIGIGRGYRPSEKNKHAGQPLGVVPVDSLFSPVRKVKYYVENTRVGQVTDYDKLILEIWTDGRMSPEEALKQSSAILKEHLGIFVNYDENYIEFEKELKAERSEKDKLEKLLSMPISEIELSVRSANCINNANIKTIGELVQKSEQEMLKYRNFGKKSLNEIKAILVSMGLALGMKLEQLKAGEGSLEPQVAGKE